MKRLLKCCLCLFLCFSLMLMQLGQDRRNAEAFVPAFLAYCAAEPLAAMLVSAGITMTASAGTQALIDWYYSSASADVKEDISSMVAGITNGIMTIPDSVWNSVKGFISDNNFSQGQNQVDYSVQVNNLSSNDLEGYWAPMDLHYIEDGSGNWGISTYDLENGKQTWSFYTSSGGKVWERTYNYPYAYDWHIAFGYNEYGPQAIHLDSNGEYQGYTSFGTGSSRLNLVWNLDRGTTGQEVVPISYVGQSVVTDSSWDIKDQETDYRQIYVPTSIDDIFGQTYEDVVVAPEDIVIPENPPVSGESTWTETAVQGVTEGVQSITDALTGTEAIENATINWEPLKIAGSTFTTKFPFSLPWDIARGFQSLVGGTWDKKFTIDLSQRIPGFRFNIDLTMWDSVVSIIRIIEVLVFDIGLILATRRLLGGAV